MAKATGRGEAVSIAVRALSATLGAYLVAYYLTEALAGGLYVAGWSKVDAAITSSTVGLLVFPAVSLWSFSARRAWMTLAAPAAACTVLALVSMAVRP